VNSRQQRKSASILALCLWSCGAPPSPAVPSASVQSAATPVEPVVVSPPAISDPAAWDGSRPIPSTGLNLGPACDSEAACQVYASECSVRPICLGSDGCQMGIGWGGKCGKWSGAEPPGICRLAVCQPGSTRPRACGELVALHEVAIRGRGWNYADWCPNEECVEKRRAQVAELPKTLGHFYIQCLLAIGVGTGVHADWDPTAPYATPFPGVSERRAPAAVPAKSEPAKPEVQP
jgi:hypothetical protein